MTRTLIGMNTQFIGDPVSGNYTAILQDQELGTIKLQAHVASTGNRSFVSFRDGPSETKNFVGYIDIDTERTRGQISGPDKTTPIYVFEKKQGEYLIGLPGEGVSTNHPVDYFLQQYAKKQAKFADQREPRRPMHGEIVDL